MQTFLPVANFKLTARILDWRRLGKQRVETKQIIRALDGVSKGWVNHPAVKMWRGHTGALAEYGLAMCAEWRLRGYKDTLSDYFIDRLAAYTSSGQPLDKPSWFGRAEVHVSHQSNLIRKLPSHYQPFFPTVSSDLPYIWPVD